MTTAQRDALCIALFGLSFLGLAAAADMFESWSAWIRSHEAWQADELILASSLMSLALAWFSWRRWREARHAAEDVGREMARGLAAEAALRRETALRWATLEHMDQGVLVVDREHRVALFNRRLTQLLDIDPAYLESQPSFEDLRERQAAAGEFVYAPDAVMAAALSGALPGASVHERSRPNGTVLEIRTVPLAGGGAVRTFSDVTARKTADAQLRDSEARYRLLAENASDMILRTGLDGIRRYVSPSCREILGYDPQELVGAPFTTFAHPDDLPSLMEAWEQFRTGRFETQTVVNRVRHKAGHWVWLETRRRLLRDADGRPAEAIGIVRDIGDRIRLEDQLRQSQKLEAIGQLTGGIAHDFNNLLTVILGNAEMLAEEIADPVLQELAATIQATAEKGSDLNHKLLAFGRRQSLRPKAVRLDEVILDIAGLLKRTLGEHIELGLDIPPAKAVAVVDRIQLESAILNLAVNARDAMPSGGRLTIEAEEVESPSGSLEYVGVTVTDTGSGMPPEVLARVFEPFFTTKEVGKGSGLGLSMVQGFVEQSGGHVTITSKAGEGTSVTLLLPAVEPHGPAEDARDEGSAGRPQAGSGKVLVVEDEADVRRYVTSTLIGLGYEVLEAPDAVAGLDLLGQDGAVDILFSDVVLPKGISGFELVRRARSLQPGLKVLLTSGHPESAFAAHGKRDADIPLLHKPYRRKDLAEALRSALDQDTPPSGRATL